MTFDEALDRIAHPDDPLLGKTVTIDGDEWTVDSYAWGGSNYVYLTRPSGDEGMKDRKDLILRPAAIVTRSIELKEG